MKYYAVTTIVDDRGRIRANITDVIETEKQPENAFVSYARKDIYVDKF